MSPKNLFSVLFICLMLASGATAIAIGGQPGRGTSGPSGGRPQGPRGEGQPPALPDSTRIVQIVEKMTKDLALTGEQKVQISDLHFAHFAQVGILMNQATGDRENHRKKMESLRDDFERAVKAELNDEQKTKFEKMSKSRRSRPDPSGQRRR